MFKMEPFISKLGNSMNKKEIREAIRGANRAAHTRGCLSLLPFVVPIALIAVWLFS